MLCIEEVIAISTNPVTDDDITLRVWEGDESVLAELVMKHFGALERFVSKEFPALGFAQPEDIVSEGIRRFWKCRDRYDGSRPIRSYLYGFVRHVAMEAVARRSKWMKSAALECQASVDQVSDGQDGKLQLRLDEIEESTPKLHGAVRQALSRLTPVHREILEAYVFCGSVEPDAASLGRELGEKFNNGVPMPAGTIRVNKLRAKQAFENELAKLGVNVDQLRRRR